MTSPCLMPCNPNVGGSSKGHLVKELDALGGEMGKNIDKTFIQSKMLNSSKGPAVHSLRAQADKQAYSTEMRKTLENQKKEEEKDKQSKEEIKEKLKIFITRYQAKEAKEQIQYYRKGKISEEERNILKEMEIRIDQLDFDEAEILMKRWEGME